MASVFKFKEFSVKQEHSAMKIGTDGVLLGAWTTVTPQPFSILDIGAGTGVIALMLAQRSAAEIIDALEIDAPAYEECVDNFEQSPWGDRLFCYHADLKEFTEEIEASYDCIVCNPPFYSEDSKSKNTQRAVARFQDAMPFQHLLESVEQLLSKNGSFSTIIPYKEEAHFMALAKKQQLYINRITHVKGHPDAPVKRSLIEFTRKTSKIETNTLIIETDRHVYTDAYRSLTKDFYLNF